VAYKWAELVLEVIEILGIPLNVATEPAIRGAIDDAVLNRPTKCLHVVTLNPEYIMAARKDPDFAYAIRRAGLITADGIGVMLAARLNQTGNLKIDRMTGVDLLRYLTAVSATADAPLFLLGAEPSVAEEAAKALCFVQPGARIAGWRSEGSADQKDDAAALERISASGAKTLAVAYGGRGQTIWIERNLDALTAADIRVAVGVGGALDFISGRVPRAPHWMQKLGLEWLYRLGKEPWRWRRQLVLPVFAILVIKARIADFFGR
jgi:N-acetylglucosaminyldiphosphoundecaprenol N-acetyl-beta-D-mannosaminyltransferase